MQKQGAMNQPKDLEAVVSARAEVRRAFIEQSASALGLSWAEGWREDLRREGRLPCGGWPGTLREARGRVEQTLTPEMRRLKMAAITEPERELAIKTAYASARSDWRRHIQPESP
jgi:hypothetical protein